jgi:hypothetical protein
LVIIDEAGGVPKSIFDAVDALATNIDARVVAVGNLDDPASHFATICKPGSGWHVETISAFDTPAYTGERVPEELLPLLVSPEWVEERKLRWGVNSPIYQSKVLGEFPDLSDDTLILPRWTDWPSSNCRLCRTTAARHRSTRNGSSMLERRTTGHCESGSSRARSNWRHGSGRCSRPEGRQRRYR